jgi:hypothetical protein
MNILGVPLAERAVCLPLGSKHARGTQFARPGKSNDTRGTRCLPPLGSKQRCAKGTSRKFLRKVDLASALTALECRPFFSCCVEYSECPHAHFPDFA